MGLLGTFGRMTGIFPQPVEKPMHRFLDSIISGVPCGYSESYRVSAHGKTQSSGADHQHAPRCRQD
jgi:hypothetical protein